MNGEILIQYNQETGMWEERKEPFAVVELPTEEDYNRLVEMMDFWKEHHKENDDA